MRVRRRGHRRAHSPVILGEHGVERVRVAALRESSSASSAASSSAPASSAPPARSFESSFVASRFLEHLLTSRLLQRLPQPGALPPRCHSVQQGVTREEHEHAVGNIHAPLFQRVAQVILIGKLRGDFEGSAQLRAPWPDAHGPGPNLLTHVHAVRRLHANGKLDPELRRERVERRQSPGCQNNASSGVCAGEVVKRERRVQRPQ